MTDDVAADRAVADDAYHRALHPVVRTVAWLRRAPRATPLDTFGDSYDAGPGGLTDTVVIASTARTGSTLLVDSLRDAGYGAGREFWSDRAVWAGYVRWGVPAPTYRGVIVQAGRAALHRRRWWLGMRVRRDEFVEYHRRVERTFTTSNGVFVIKVFPYHLTALEQRTGLVADDLLSGRLRWVHLRRHDKLAQAVSHYRATVTDAWVDRRGDSGGSRPVRFDADAVDADGLAEIRRRVDGFRQWETWWERFFDRGGIEPVVLDYEDLADDPGAAMRAVVAGLGDGVVSPVESPTRRQRDAESDRLYARVLATYPECAT